jgi:hypothetical protein
VISALRRQWSETGQKQGQEVPVAVSRSSRNQPVSPAALNLHSSIAQQMKVSGKAAKITASNAEPTTNN